MAGSGMAEAPERRADAPKVSAGPPSLAFLAIAMATMATVIDGVSITLALPALVEAFGVPPGEAALVVTVSQLVIVALILPLSSLGDRFGYRTIFLASLGICLPATLAAVLSPDLGWLLVARAVQAVGLAGVMSVNFALVRSIYPAERIGRGVGNLATIVALATAAGPALAGMILSVASWHWVLAMIMPLQMAAIFAGALLLPAATPRKGGRTDAVGALLAAVMMSALILAPVALTGGWPAVTAAAALAVSLGTFLLLRRRLRDDPEPVFPFDLFRIRAFATGIAASTAMFAAQFAAFVGIPFFFTAELGLSPLAQGLLFSTWPAAVAATAPFYGRLADRLPARPLCLISALVLLVGLSLLALTPRDASVLDVAWRLVICGLGFAGFQTPNNRLLVSVAPRHRSGAASGMMATARQLGRALGVAAAALLLTLPFGDARMILWLAAALAGLAAVSRA